MTVFNPHPMMFGVQPSCWLDAADIHERIDDGSGDLTDALDKSGNSEDFSATSAAQQPTIQTAALGGKDIWTGSVANNCQIDGSVVLTTECTIFIVCDREAAYQQAYIMGGSASGASPAILVNYSTGPVQNFAIFDAGAFSAPFSTSGITGFHVLAVTNITIDGNTTTIGYLDGTQVFSDVGNSWGGTSITSLFNNNIGADPYDGSIGSFVIYPKIFQPWEIVQLTRYFQNRRGI